MRSLLLTGALFATGSALVLGELRWFRRRPLASRLAPYVPGARAVTRSGTWGTGRELVTSVAHRLGDRAARFAGVGEPLRVRLRRIHSPLEPARFRARQLAWCGAGLAAGTVLAAVLGLPGPLALAFVLGGPVLAFLLVEQNLARASQAWQRRLFLELPVVAEQLGMLLGAGYSLGAAVGRLADRGHGAASRDMQRVVARVRLGLSDGEALQEWADLADVRALHQLVGVLALDRQAGDLGELISAEARAIRREVHRELLATVERRAQQVWVPVTVATLVPGMIFLAVPFVDALRMFSAS